MPEVAAQTMPPEQMPAFAITTDGRVFVNGKPLMLPTRPQGQSLALLNDIVILLATAASSAIVVKQALDQVLGHAGT